MRLLLSLLFICALRPRAAASLASNDDPPRKCVPFHLPAAKALGPAMWASQSDRDRDVEAMSLGEVFLKHRRWAGVRVDVHALLAFAKGVIAPYFREWGSFPAQHPLQMSPEDAAKVPPYSYYRGNRMYESSDPILMHSVVRAFKPRRVLEVGSGFSTRVSAAALVLNEQDCGSGYASLVALEPNPARLPKPLPGLTALHQNYLEGVRCATSRADTSAPRQVCSDCMRLPLKRALFATRRNRWGLFSSSRPTTSL